MSAGTADSSFEDHGLMGARVVVQPVNDESEPVEGHLIDEYVPGGREDKRRLVVETDDGHDIDTDHSRVSLA